MLGGAKLAATLGAVHGNVDRPFYLKGVKAKGRRQKAEGRRQKAERQKGRRSLRRSRPLGIAARDAVPSRGHPPSSAASRRSRSRSAANRCGVPRAQLRG